MGRASSPALGSNAGPATRGRRRYAGPARPSSGLPRTGDGAGQRSGTTRFPGGSHRTILGDAALSLIVSALSLGLSLTTAWMTLGRRGRLKMTAPSIVHVGFDSPIAQRRPKVFLRTLLYSTAARGQVVDRLFARIKRRGSDSATFGFWGYVEAGRVVPGSGLYIPQAGIVTNHHFVPAAGRSAYTFEAGRYLMEVFAVPAGGRAALLSRLSFDLTADHAQGLRRGGGVLFEADPDTSEYLGTLRNIEDEEPRDVR